MVHVVDLLDPVVLLQRHRVEAAHLADAGERGLEPGEAFQGGLADVLVAVEHDQAVAVDDGDDRAVERAVGLGLGGAGLRLERVGVHVLAGEALEGRDQVGADALRDERRREVGLGVHRPGPAVRGHRHAGHRLDAAGDDHVLPAGAHPLPGLVDGLEPGGAEAVELHAADVVGQAGRDGRGLGDVTTLVADRRDAAQHDVLDAVGVERGLRVRSSSISPVTRETGLVACSDPVLLPRPRGVRMAS